MSSVDEYRSMQYFLGTLGWNCDELDRLVGNHLFEKDLLMLQVWSQTRAFLQIPWLWGSFESEWSRVQQRTAMKWRMKKRFWCETLKSWHWHQLSFPENVDLFDSGSDHLKQKDDFRKKTQVSPLLWPRWEHFLKSLCVYVCGSQKMTKFKLQHSSAECSTVCLGNCLGSFRSRLPLSLWELDPLCCPKVWMWMVVNGDLSSCISPSVCWDRLQPPRPWAG